MIGCRSNINSEFSKKVCFSRISRLKVTYMFMALTMSLVVLFIAVLLQIFRGIFYSNASCFSLLWLYLGNSQVNVYRTIGPTLVTLSSHWYEKSDKASPSIILAGRALLLKMLITLESCYAFGSNFQYYF